MTSKSQRIRAKITAESYGITPNSLGYTLRQARKAMGISAKHIADCLCVSTYDWLKYEQNNKLVPSNIVMKLVMFGMDFWARNKKCFENEATIPATCGDTPPTEGN